MLDTYEIAETNKHWQTIFHFRLDFLNSGNNNKTRRMIAPFYPPMRTDMESQHIENDLEHEIAMQQIIALLNSESGSAEERELDRLVTMVEEYEELISKSKVEFIENSLEEVLPRHKSPKPKKSRPNLYVRGSYRLPPR